MRKFRKIELITLISLLTPFNWLHAQYTPPNLGGDRTPVNPGAGGEGVRLNNPLGDTTIMDFLGDLLDVIMIFAVPLIVFMIIYAGFTYVMARGNPGEVSRASKMLLYSVIGGVIILGAWAILEVIDGTVDAFRN